MQVFYFVIISTRTCLTCFIKIVLKIFKFPAYRYFGIKKDFFPSLFLWKKKKKIVKFPLTVLDFSLIILSKVEGNFKNLKCFHFPTFSKYHSEQLTPFPGLWFLNTVIL